VTSDGSKVYVTNAANNTVSVIDAATNRVTATISGFFDGPFAFGVFIQPPKPAPRFAGTPGFSNCYGQSVAALARQFGGLSAAAAASALSGVGALQNAILAFCGG
jgi:YVTN family beta-propeller protein